MKELPKAKEQGKMDDQRSTKKPLCLGQRKRGEAAAGGSEGAGSWTVQRSVCPREDSGLRRETNRENLHSGSDMIDLPYKFQNQVGKFHKIYY